MLQHKIRFKDKPEDNYDILIERDILSKVSEIVKEFAPKRRIAILTDQNVVDAGHLKKLDPNGDIPTYIIQPDERGGVESRKNVETLGEVIDFLDADKFSKKDAIICLGGGVVALGYKRGRMVYVQVPTTTLSQADSCVGGKVAIDSKVSKNSFGGIYQPSLVIIDPTTVRTQDGENYRAGLVESIKHGIILDEDYFALFEEQLGKLRTRDLDLLEQIAFRNVQLKGSVVEIDPNDENYRHSLNFGHTIGHAIEQVSEYKLSHGESVAKGIPPVLYISKELRGFPKSDLDRIESLLADGLNINKEIPSFIDRSKVESKLANDKKAIDGVPQFVTLDGIGELHVENGRYSAPIPKSLLKESLDYIF